MRNHGKKPQYPKMLWEVASRILSRADYWEGSPRPVQYRIRLVSSLQEQYWKTGENYSNFSMRVSKNC